MWWIVSIGCSTSDTTALSEEHLRRQTIARFDLDQDGAIDLQEWSRYAQQSSDWEQANTDGAEDVEGGARPRQESSPPSPAPRNL